MARLVLLLFFFLSFIAQVAVAQSGDSPADSSFHPNLKPTLDIKRRAGIIVIDGDVDDAGWQGVEMAQNFSQSFPVHGLKPLNGTSAKITYDDENLYVAMIAEDSFPADIRSSFCSRDNISGDDFMGIVLDTYGDGSRAFEIYSNPCGIQEDLFWTANREDGSYDLVYESEAKITATGWQVEFKIPFRSLRFPDVPVQNFHCSFWRSYPREVVHKYSWASVNFYVPCAFCQFGTLTGIENIHPAGSFEILPALVASQSAVANTIGSPLENKKIKVSPSLGARYALGTATGLEVALNPDFSQVESDAAQISANTTFALYYPERRPFFQDGSDLLTTNIDAIYTRSINTPLVAAKAIHRDETTSIAYIGALDEHSPLIVPLEEKSIVQSDVGKSIANILRATHSFGNNTKIGALLTNRTFNDDGLNTVAGLDGRIQIVENFEVIAQGLVSVTTEPTGMKNGDTGFFDSHRYSIEYDGEHFTGYGGYLTLQRHTNGLDFELDYEQLSPTFRAADGAVFSNDAKNAYAWVGYKFPLSQHSWFNEFDMSVLGSYVNNFEGQTKLIAIKPELDFSFVGQTNLHIYMRHAPKERFHGVEFSNLNFVNIWGETTPLSSIGIGFVVVFGHSIARFLDTPSVGREFDLTLNAAIKPLNGLLIEPEYNFSRLDSLAGSGSYFSGAIYRTKVSYQFSRKMNARVIVQYNEFSNALEIDPLFTYQINPFTSVYVGSSHNYRSFDAYSPLQPSQRQFFAKLQYLIQG